MNKKIYKKLLLIIFSLSILTTYYVLHTNVFAQSANTPALNITVTPATIDLTANPGSTIQQKIRVRNNTSSPIDFNIKTSKLSTNDKGDIIPVESNEDYISWVSYTPSTFSARPQEWTDVTVQVKIPSTASFGYYYAIRITPTNSDVKKQTNGSTVIGEALVPLLLNVKKTGAIANVQLVSFAPTQSFYEYLPATFAITFMNRGNVHIRPHGNVFIRTGSDADTAILDVNLSNGAMLPGQKRTYTTLWNDGFFVQEPVVADGTIQKDKYGNPQTHLVVHWDKLTSFRIGKYTAHLLAVYDNGTRDVPIESTITFWVFPYKMILGIILSLVVLVVLVRIWLKWYVARAVKKSRSS